MTVIWGQLMYSVLGSWHTAGWTLQWSTFRGRRAVSPCARRQIYEGILYRYRVVFLALSGHTGPPQTDGCWQWLAAIWVAVNWRDSWAHFMPHRFVWNVRDLDLSMCGQRSLGAWNLGSFENKIRHEGVNVCMWVYVALRCDYVIVGVEEYVCENIHPIVIMNSYLWKCTSISGCVSVCDGVNSVTKRACLCCRFSIAQGQAPL